MEAKDKHEKLSRRWMLAGLFFVPAVFCLVYFVIIIPYSGITTSFIFAWPFMSVVFVLMGYYTGRALKRRGRMPHFIPTFIFTSFVLGCIIFTILMSMVLRHTGGSEDNERTDYTIVLGAKVYSDGISKTLMYRLDRAYEYYEEHPETTLVLSGGKEANDALPEALAMYNYLSVKGVPGGRMLMDIEASSTVENIENSIRIIAADVNHRKTAADSGMMTWDEDYVPSLAIITSDFHMMRTVRIARELGIETVAEIPAQSDSMLFLHQCVRECAAILKDYFVGNIKVNEEELPFNKK